MTLTQPAALRIVGGFGFCLLAAVLAAVPTQAGNYLADSDSLERWTPFRGVQVVANAGAAPDERAAPPGASSAR